MNKWKQKNKGTLRRNNVTYFFFLFLYSVSPHIMLPPFVFIFFGMMLNYGGFKERFLQLLNIVHEGPEERRR